MDLVPAIDLRQGRVVRLRQGDDGARTVYAVEPEGVLAACAAAGVRLVHLVDLDAALGEPPQRALVERLAGLGERPALQLGGGLRAARDVAWALGAGCARAVLGSLPAADPEGFAALAVHHPGRLVPALDVRRGAVRVGGWRETASRSLADLTAALRGAPCPAVLVTDVDRDGTASGPNLELACAVARQLGLPALVSGGVRSLDDLRRAAAAPEIAGAVVGRALYDGAFTLAQALSACRGAEGVA
jgi:phosphoribosylformimino-5-aminoimidazole carboxamide ribotide isomerase